MAAIRGELLPLVDVGARMGQAPGADATGQLLVLASGDGTAVLAVERVEGLETLAPADVMAAPSYAGEAAQAVADVRGELVVVLRPDALLG